jgi:hypothetical protein
MPSTYLSIAAAREAEGAAPARGVAVAARGVRAILAAIGVLGLATMAQAETIQGNFCPIAHVRVNGAAGSLMREKLWEYKGEKAPFHPVFGWVDLACWNTAGAVPIDIAKRAWFAASGPEGAVGSQTRIQFADPQTVSSQSGVGITAEGTAIMGTVFPGHDCVFAVQVWSETCPPR